MTNEKKLAYLDAMGIEVWRLRDKQEQKPHQPEIQIGAPITTIPHPKAPRNANNPGWDELAEKVSTCTLCELSQTRTHVVFGAGNAHADLMIIGEAPGANEDKQGKPFVGRAGTLLTNMLRAIGINREDIFITNILKCRPPGNRDPKPLEVELCTPYLKQQIAMIAPKLIVAVGRIAAHFLLNTDESMSKIRGKMHYYENIPLIATYHPAYLLRSPAQKAKAYDDLLKIQELVT
ncbi:MAG: uracil-DNA glycosylase [Gammaproteobacteria bacterium]|nr:uracil-DNA glycosylase [Gammaproteobacteria bacterium]